MSGRRMSERDAALLDALKAINAALADVAPLYPLEGVSTKALRDAIGRFERAIR